MVRKNLITAGLTIVLVLLALALHLHPVYAHSNHPPADRNGLLAPDTRTYPMRLMPAKLYGGGFQIMDPILATITDQSLENLLDFNATMFHINNLDMYLMKGPATTRWWAISWTRATANTTPSTTTTSPSSVCTHRKSAT